MRLDESAPDSDPPRDVPGSSLSDPSDNRPRLNPTVSVAWPMPFVDDRTPDEEPPAVELWRAVGDVTPWGTMLMLFAWALVFALTAWRQELGFADALVVRGANTAPGGVVDALWRSLASTFLHASVSHVLFNALTLLVLGQATERVFARGGFLVVAMFGGSLASFGSLAWRTHVAPSAPGIAIGGSGMVFALGGALLVAAVRLRRYLAVGRARAFAAVIMLLVLPGLASGFERFGTDNAAHTAGLLAGFALGACVPLRTALGGPPRSIATDVLGGLASLALLLTFLLVLRGQGVGFP